MKVIAGIDVGKRELVVSVRGGPVRSFKNEAEGIRELGEWLREPPRVYRRRISVSQATRNDSWHSR